MIYFKKNSFSCFFKTVFGPKAPPRAPNLLHMVRISRKIQRNPNPDSKKYINNNKQLFFELDVNGAVSLMNYYPNNTISIFLSPPNLEELRKRLVLRSTETEDEINKRLSRFEEEDNLKKEFDYNLINDNFETTFEKIKEIINKNKKED